MKTSIALAERIKKLMEQKGITKSELIKKSKLSSSTVNNVLQGKTDKVLMSTLCAVMNALDTGLFEFFNDDLLSFENLEITMETTQQV